MLEKSVSTDRLKYGTYPKSVWASSDNSKKENQEAFYAQRTKDTKSMK